MPVKTLTGTNHPDSDTVHEIAKCVMGISIYGHGIHVFHSTSFATVALGCRSVSSCVSISRAAQSLIFEGIHLKLRDVRCLVTVRGNYHQCILKALSSS